MYSIKKGSNRLMSWTSLDPVSNHDVQLDDLADFGIYQLRLPIDGDPAGRLPRGQMCVMSNHGFGSGC